MDKGIKVVVIGGGSSYTPELIEGFINRYEELPISEMWLVDIDEGKERVKIISALAQHMWDAANHQVKVFKTLNRREALANADFVLTQLRVGGLETRIIDERIPLKYGMLGQETNGAGGILKALRTIPVMGEIVKDMKELCPQAWLINFTNPSGMVTEAVIKHFGWNKCIGLCNVPTIAMMAEPALLGLKREDLTYRFAGLNHFHWHKVYDRKGADLTSKLIEHINDQNGGTPVNIYMTPFSIDLLNSMNLLPCGYHRYYYNEQDMLDHSIEEFNTNATRAEKVFAVERALFEIYRDPSVYKKPEELSKRGGAFYSDTACECINAIFNNKKNEMVVSTQNNGAISCLDDDSIVEVSSIISAKGAEPIAWGSMRFAEKGWLQVMKAMEECTIHAALSGDYGMTLEAFTINPLIRGGKKAKQILDELLIAHEKHLPLFTKKIQELKGA